LEFLERVKRNRAVKEEAKKNGQSFDLKRKPLAPRESRVVSFANAPITITPVPYEALV
jgi:large subunit ribosomal protein L21e